IREYETVKNAVLKAYERIPEHYRQKFRNWRKTDKQTYTDVARELVSLFNRWCVSVGANTYEALTDLVILEQFKNILPERIATYVYENKVTSAAQAAGLVDEFVLTHKSSRDRSQSEYSPCTSYG
uniref:SCAN box domain-containing protein n=1 Tax=Takifugu rubripes TaxID=31033 RepID=A0A674P1H8_TAKRU